MLCDYGCGELAQFEFLSGKRCCSKHPRQCSFVTEQAIAKRRAKGPWHSNETKSQISSTSKRTRTTSWIAGKTKETDASVARISSKLTGRQFSEETKRRNSEAHKGKTPWNKGLSAEDDSRILSGDKNGMSGKTHTDEIREALRERAKGHWEGEKNPWYGRSRSGELSPRWVAEEIKSEYRRYYGEVSFLTEETYCLHHRSINPENYPRTLCGVPGGYQLDHIIPVKYGFDNNLDASILAHKDNLQMISWQENRSKWDSLTEEAEEILKRLIERK